MSPSFHLVTGVRWRVALLTALLAPLLLRVGPSAGPLQDLSATFHKSFTKTHQNLGNQLLDDAVFQLKQPAQAVVLPLRVTSSVVAEPQPVPPTFDGRGWHYNRPPPLTGTGPSAA